jgi:hypothetical protein
MEPVDSCSRKLQGLSTLISEQENLLKTLTRSLRSLLAIAGPYSPADVASFRDAQPADELIVVGSQYVVTRSAIRDLVQDMGSFAMELHGRATKDDALEVEIAIGRLFVKGLEGILKIQSERDNTNGPRSLTLPPVMPHQLAELQPREFNRIAKDLVQRYAGADLQRLEYLEGDFRDFKSALHDSSLRTAVESSAPEMGFEEAWQPFGRRCSKVRDFCGGLATVFPGLQPWSPTSVCSTGSLMSIEARLRSSH